MILMELIKKKNIKNGKLENCKDYKEITIKE